MPTPKAVLLDVGGVLLVPLHDRILGAFGRAGFTPAVEVLDRAHYAGAAALGSDVEAEVEIDWSTYLDAYITECGGPEDLRSEIHEHLDSEYAVAALWMRVLPGVREGLRALTDAGVRLGVISNADGFAAQRLAEAELLQVGPGIGARVDCIIDSGAVGVDKPDPRIFHLALEAMDLTADDAWYVGDTPVIDVVGARRAGIRPVVMDPYQFHLDANYDRVDSLPELAARISAG